MSRAHGPSDWEDRYTTGDLPWDTGLPAPALTHLVASRPIPAGRALEIGCGTGTNAIWLAQQGFAVTAVDLSSHAIAMARDKVAAAGVQVALHVNDVLTESLPAGPYQLVFDRGCFHVFDSPEHRRHFARQVAAVLDAGGLWISLVGSTEGPPRESGPPRRSARDLVNAVEDVLEILAIEATTFDTKLSFAASAWRCVFTKRVQPAQQSTVRQG